MEFGDTLARLRTGAGMTTVALAQSVGLDPLTIEQIERGERTDPERQLVLGLARALELNDAQTDELLWSANQLPDHASRADGRGNDGHTVALFVDHENVYIALCGIVRALPPEIQGEERRKVEPASLALQLRSLAEEIGWVKVALAVADWERLPSGQVKEYLKLRYQIDYNLPGRNNADLKLSDAIRDVLEDSNYADVDTYVLVTGDGGYLTVLETLLRRQKRVYVWGVHGATNHLLVQNATDVAWIDEMLDLPAVEPTETNGRYSSDGNGVIQHAAEYAGIAVGNDVSRLEALAVRLSRYLQVRSWSFITFVRFLGFLDETGIFGATREDQLAWLSHTKETGVLREEIVDDPSDKTRIARRFFLNEQHPLVARALAIRARVGEIVPAGGRGLAFGVVVDRLINDSQLRISDVQAKNWLTWFAESGFLQAEQVPHFRKEGVTVTLLRQGAGTWDRQPPAEAEIDRDRLVRDGEFAALRLANFLDRHPHFGWMALSQLLNRMALGYDTDIVVASSMTRQDAKQAIAVAQEREFLRIDQIPNLKTGGMTTVARLNRDEPRVAELLTLRDALIHRLAAMSVNRPAVSRAAFQSSVSDQLGLPPDDSATWVEFLVAEGIFRLEPSHDGASAALRTDQQDLIVSRVLFRATTVPLAPTVGRQGLGVS